MFNQHWLAEKIALFEQKLEAVDIQATLLELTVQTIANDINNYASKNSSVFICGGGAHNDYLLERLQVLLNNKNVSSTEYLNLHPDWVEACAFAWLAYRTMNNQAGNLPSVTGAKHPVVLGAIYPA